MGKTPKLVRCTCDAPKWSGEYFVKDSHKRAICEKCGLPVSQHRTAQMIIGGDPRARQAEVALTDALVAQYAYLNEQENATLSSSELAARQRRLEDGAKETLLKMGDRQAAVADLFFRAMQAIETAMGERRATGELSEAEEERYLNMLSVAARAFNTHQAASVRTLKAADTMKKATPADEWAEMMRGATKVDASEDSDNTDADE